MSSIDKRVGRSGRVKYRARVRVRGQTRTATFARKTDAKNWASETDLKLRLARHVPTSTDLRRTVSDLIARYLKYLEYKPRNRDAKNVRQQLGWWRKEIGHVSLADCTPALICECRDKLRLGKTHLGNRRSPATVNRYLAALSHTFETARREWQWIQSNPVRLVSKLTEPRGRIRFLDDDERNRLLEACNASTNPHLYPIVVLALSTGARKGELRSLRWPYVDLARGRFVLHETKNRDRRALPLTGHALDLMRELGKVRRIDTDLVFPGRRSDRPATITKAWYQALKKADINDFRFHDLRHSAASYLAMNGATPSEIAAILGHRTLQMVKRYAHLSDEHTANVVAAMNSKIFMKTS